MASCFPHCQAQQGAEPMVSSGRDNGWAQSYGCPSYQGTGRTLEPGSVVGQGEAVWVTWMLRWTCVLIKAAESKRRTQMCPAREMGLPEMCITGLRGTQQAHLPEQSGVHCLRSIPAGKKDCCSGLEVVWWEENLQAISNCNLYPCHSEISSLMFQVCLACQPTME